jgi:hypothetical protein
MKSLLSQLFIGIVVTVIGTLIADALLGGGKLRKRFMGGIHYSGTARAGR